ncbi:hypothetical protein A6V39_05150 [Candidatus Mycoplasma haematobovis]|uniref:Uncharacterized protein n=1 Tax=Candidatus Mycoplasma haematobovis TaxID=432608 RepID=A0A1A9QCY6_9MOLU|nr:hypothetical protein [Candidatus Mycoplasma haematobovis]OAL09815.1 hypothetical protein A6V39_05150 [Candidatus Mycoplasma haematobovis]
MATVSLVSFRKEDSKKNADDEDKVLNDFELQAKKFEEKTMLYSKDGQNEPVTLENDALKDKILEKFKEGENLGDLAKELPNADQIEKLLSEVKESNLVKSMSQKDSEPSRGIESSESQNSPAPEPIDTAQSTEENLGAGKTDIDEKLDENIDSSHTEASGMEDLLKKLGEENANKNDGQPEPTSDKEDSKEEKTENDDSGNNVAEGQESTTPLEAEQDKAKNTQQDQNGESKEDIHTKQDLQIERNSDDSKELESKDPKATEAANSEQKLHQNGQEPNREVKDDKASDITKSSVDGESTEGKKTLSPEEVKHWEDLLNTVGDVATQLQLLVIDKN